MKDIDEKWVADTFEAAQAAQSPRPERAIDLAANINQLIQAVEQAQELLEFESEPSAFSRSLSRHRDGGEEA